MFASDLPGVQSDAPIDLRLSEVDAPIDLLPVDLSSCESCHQSAPLVTTTFGSWPNLSPFRVCVSCAQAAVYVGIRNRVHVSIGA